MPKKSISSLRCPTCRTLVLRTDPDFPFCSDRCRMIDLGKWVSGRYVISSPINSGDESVEADYTSNRRVERVQGPGSVRQTNGHDQEGHDDDRNRR
jgi:uncharacterized protein